jgi:RNA polymerase primary sigma factor
LPASERFDDLTEFSVSRNTDVSTVAFAAEQIARPEVDAQDSSRETLLTRYFREMAPLHVMSPDEELECAQALEQAELEQWTALLAYIPAAESILASLMRDINAAPDVERPNLPEVEDLRHLAGAYRKQRSRLTLGQLRRWNELSTEFGRRIRPLDTERKWIAQAIDVAEQGCATNRADGGTSPVAKTQAYLRYVARVRRTDSRRQQVKNRFVRANLRLVVTIAHHHNHGRLPLDDLIQEGNIGLIKAIDRFDYARGYRFSTYATWWIRHCISRALADKGRTVRVPVHMLDVIRCLAVATSSILARTGREPTLEELAKDTGISTQRLVQARECSGATTLSLDRPVGDDDDRRYIDLLADKNALSPTDNMAKQAWLEEVQRLLGGLTPIETRIIRWRYGLDDDVELTLKEIGDRYGLSRERIRQLQQQALRKMRKQTHDDWR